MKDLRSFVPALCNLMGITPPSLSKSVSYLEENSIEGKIEKALIYCPDAFGYHALKKFPQLYERVFKNSTHEVELHSVYPSVTPVCFASLFTGAFPGEHGITRYEKPVLTCDTVFDALIRAGKKVAIVAVRDSSVDKIFRNRNIDYKSVSYDPFVTVEVLKLLEANQHDLIVAYQQEYDDLLHVTGVFSEVSTLALQRHVETWELLNRECAKAWEQNYLLAFTPDHGAHTVPETQLGDHGEQRPEDMELRHFFTLK